MSRGDVIAVQDQDQIAVGLRQCVIDISGLCLAVVLSGEVMNAKILGHPHEPVASLPCRIGGGGIVAFRDRATIIEHINAKLFPRIVNLYGGLRGQQNNVVRFVVGGDEHVHGGQARRIRGQRGGLALRRPEHGEQSNKVNGDCVDLGKIEQRHTDKIERSRP